MKTIIILVALLFCSQVSYAKKVNYKVLHFSFKINTQPDGKDSKSIHQFTLNNNYPGEMIIVSWWDSHDENLDLAVGHVNGPIVTEEFNQKIKTELGFPVISRSPIKKMFSIEKEETYEITKDWFVSIADFEFRKLAAGDIYIIYPSSEEYSEKDCKLFKEIAELYNVDFSYKYIDNNNIVINISTMEMGSFNEKKTAKFERLGSKDEIDINSILNTIKEFAPQRAGASVSSIPFPQNITSDNNLSSSCNIASYSTSPNSDFLTTESNVKKIDYENSFYEYMIFSVKHREKVFAWQLFSSKIIFLIVMILVIVGIFFSWLQFRKGFSENDSGEDTQTELELSTSGFKIKSSILGLIILIISLAFFYMYLLYVYPIDTVPLDHEMINKNINK